MPKIVDHEQYRRQLLGQCFDLFAEKGYGSITMREIAKGLGVSTGTLYHYFPSKESLFEQLIQELVEQDLLRISQEMQSAQTLAERIQIGFDLLAKNEDYFIKQILLSVEFYQQQGPEKMQQNSILKQVDQRGRQGIADLLGVQDPALITFLICLVDGLLLHRLYDQQTISFVEQAEIVTQMLTTYLQQKGVDVNRLESPTPESMSPLLRP